MKHLLRLSALLAVFVTPALAGDLVEPSLHIAAGLASGPEVALTLDACSGDVDYRILDMLVDHQVPATIFVTGRWLRRNPDATAILVKHPELFEVEDHGLNHVPAVLGTEKPYGLEPAGTVEAVLAEVDGGAIAVTRATHQRPHWYRDATALYSPAAITAIEADHFRIAGFSLNADFGATASEAQAETRLSSAVDGDVIIAHINQPKRASGGGIAKGIADLLARGYRFVTLAEALPD